jgi:hypothetical protein
MTAYIFVTCRDLSSPDTGSQVVKTFDDLDLDLKRQLVNEDSRYFWCFVRATDAAPDTQHAGPLTAQAV